MAERNDPPGARPSPLALPETPRVLPFVLFLLVGSLQGKLFPGSEYWCYAAKTIGVGGLLWAWRGRIAEMRWAVGWEAVAVGAGIAVLWLGLDGRVPSLNDLWDQGRHLLTGGPIEPPKPEAPWNPVAYFAGQPALGWGFVILRLLGRSLVVPAMEEVFYRSFVYRYVMNPRFDTVALGVWHPTAFLVTGLLFALAHPGQWLPALVCGFAYQWLVLRRRRLGDAMTAHGLTNLIISVYAIATGRWQFT